MADDNDFGFWDNPDFWTDYYVKNPNMLCDFIKATDEQTTKMFEELVQSKAEIDQLRAELATTKADNERLHDSISSIAKGVREGTRMLRTENEKLRAAVYSVINWGLAEGDGSLAHITKQHEILAQLVDSIAYPYEINN